MFCDHSGDSTLKNGQKFDTDSWPHDLYSAYDLMTKSLQVANPFIQQSEVWSVKRKKATNKTEQS